MHGVIQQRGDRRGRVQQVGWEVLEQWMALQELRAVMADQVAVSTAQAAWF